MKGQKKNVVLLCVALILIFVGSLFAALFHTSFGKVQVTEVTYVSEDGARFHSLLYVPDSATVENPAPAVIAAHGYNNTAEVQTINAVELSRRGFVVLAIDHYSHGDSSATDPRVADGITADMGVYSGLQYVGRLPYVDAENVGLIGHSMGGSTIQIGAMRAFMMHDADPSVVIPKAIMPTSQAFLGNADNTALAYGDYPVNVAVIFSEFDEWHENMWGAFTGKDINTTPKGVAGMGFSGAEYNTWYVAGDDSPIDREDAIEAATDGELRAIFQHHTTHPGTHWSFKAARWAVDFFNITLREGKQVLPLSNQAWVWKEIFTGIALVGFLLFIVPFTSLLLNTPYFRTIVRPLPNAPSAWDSGKSKVIYWLIFLVMLLPAPLLWNWAVGYPIDIQDMGRAVPTVLKTSDFFNLPAVNGLVILNVLLGVIMLAAFILTYIFIFKKKGVTYDQIGVKLPAKEVGKAFLLALIVFVTAYLLIAVVRYFFTIDFRFWVWSIRALPAVKWITYLKYLPFFLFFFLISSLTLNSFTRVRNQKDWKNIVLMVVAMIGGILVFTLIDYIVFFTTGRKAWMYVPYPPGDVKMTSALAGVLLWGVEFIFPVSAVYAFYLFKKTGSIWLGGFVNAFVITLFAMSNTVFAGGIL
jgi:hypothetical protein